MILSARPARTGEKVTPFQGYAFLANAKPGLRPGLSNDAALRLRADRDSVADDRPQIVAHSIVDAGVAKHGASASGGCGCDGSRRCSGLIARRRQSLPARRTKGA